MVSGELPTKIMSKSVPFHCKPGTTNVPFDCQPESPIPCPFKVGDDVIYTNDQGCEYRKKVIGFTPEPAIFGDDVRFVYVHTDCWWMPVALRSLRAAPSDKDQAISAFRWAYAAVCALAVKLLEEENKACGENWPAGQSWDELGGTSKAVYLRRAREISGIPHDDFLAVVRSDSDAIQDIYMLGRLAVK